MTETMTELMMIRYTFGQLAERASAAIPMFFQRLFEIAPQVRPMFPGDLSSHQRKFTTMLIWLVDHVDKPDQLVPALRELGARHRRYGVTAAMFAPAGEALLYTFHETLGNDFSPEVELVWSNLFSTIAAEMERGAEESLIAAQN